MGKKKDDKLFCFIRDFLTVYLPEQRCCTQNTIKSYRETLNILFDYIRQEKNIPLAKITFSTLDHKMISEFLDWLEKERKCSVVTRNHRLSCIHTFFKYTVNMDPVLTAYLIDLQKIPSKKAMKSRVMEFMSEEALEMVLAQPDTKSKKGIRDLFFMVLMYDTAARNRELLDLKVKDFVTDAKTPCVYLIGKGKKRRVVPLMQKTVEHFHRYMKIFHEDRNPDQFLFYTTTNEEKHSMSDDNVARFMKQYGASARKSCNEIPLKIHPHMFRRTRAMHLYRSGMPLALLSEWLGHEDPETTLIYAYADTEMKRKAIEKATNTSNCLKEEEKLTPFWQNDDEIMRKLYGLK